MRICLQCTAQLNHTGWGCPACGWRPVFRDGLPILSPELAAGSPDYPVDAHEHCIHFEEANFWFKCRNRIIIHCLELYFPAAAKLLEIGCGTGFVLSGLSQAFPGMELFGAEAYPSALKYASKRVRDAEFAQMDAYRLPFVEEFDVVGAFDVLEHLDEDFLALKELYRATKNSGGLILTVPQHPWLWSRLDDESGHKRRYTCKELKRKVEAAGFEVLFMTSFIMTLLPLMVTSRLRKNRQYRKKTTEIQCELNLSKKLNTFLQLACLGDNYLIRKGFALPAGGSLLCIAKKTLE